MKRLVALMVVASAAVSADAAVYERYLNESDPTDRQILTYMEMRSNGTATSVDLTQMGVLLFQKGFPEDAEDVLRAALDLDEENYEAAYRLGLVLQRMGEHRKAARFYRKVVEVRPGYAYAQFMLGLAEERSGDRRDAIRHFAKAYKHAPELANPAVNPLVLDSGLQTAAMLLHYEQVKRGQTFRPTLVDPWEVEIMQRVKAED